MIPMIQIEPGAKPRLVLQWPGSEPVVVAAQLPDSIDIRVDGSSVLHMTSEGLMLHSPELQAAGCPVKNLAQLTIVWLTDAQLEAIEEAR